MDRERELALRARLRALDILLPEYVIDAMVELEEQLPMDDVESIMVLEELGVFPSNDPSDSGESGALVRQPIGPRPNRNSGAIKPTN